MQQQILQFVINSKMKHAKEPTFAAKPAVDDLLQGVTPAIDANNLSGVDTQPTSMTEESTAFMTRSEVEAMLKMKKEKACASVNNVDMMPPYPIQILKKLYSIVRRRGRGLGTPLDKSFY